jgi:hypothetical protein
MRTRGRLYLTFAAISLLPLWVGAQVVDCPQFPAPCPHSEEINQAMDFTGREQNNRVTPEEMAMETNLRNNLTDILQNLGHKHHWQVYELTESNYDRPNTFVDFYTWEHTPYEKRPPHVYEISFIIVVNKDSLQAWRDWLQGDFANQSNQVVADIKADGQSSSNDQVLQSLTDSVQYYAQLSGKYTQDHYSEFIAAIQSNDQKAQKRYNDKIAEYQKKQDALMKKIQDRGSSDNASSGNSLKRFDAEKISKTEKFVNSSVLLVYFAANKRHADFGLDDGSQKAVNPQQALQVRGAFYAGLLTNLSPPDGQSYLINEFDFTYAHPSHIGSVLFGKWLSKRTSYNLVPAAFMASNANTDLTSPKSIKCDKVQNLAMYLEGRPDYIRQVLNEVDVNALEKLTVQ